MDITYSYSPQSATVCSCNILATNRSVVLKLVTIQMVMTTGTTIHACSKLGFGDLKGFRYVCII